MNPHALRRVLGEKTVSNKPKAAEPRTRQASGQHDPGVEKAKYASLSLRPSDLKAITTGLDKARAELPAGSSDCRPVEEENGSAGGSAAQQHPEGEISSSAGYKAPTEEFQQGHLPHSRRVQDFPGLLDTRAPAGTFPHTPARPCSSPDLDISTPMSALCVSGNDRRYTLSPMTDDASPMNTSGTCPGSSSASEVPETPSSSADGKKALRTPFSGTPPSYPRTAPGRRSATVASRSNLQEMDRNPSLRMWWDYECGRSGGKCLSARSFSSDDMSVACEQAASFRTPVSASQRPHAAAWGCTPSPAANGKALRTIEGAHGSPAREPSEPLIQPGQIDGHSNLFAFTNWTQLESEALHPEEDGTTRSDGSPCHQAYSTAPGDRDAAAERTAAATLNWTQLEECQSLRPEEDRAGRSADTPCHHADSTTPQNGASGAERIAGAALNWTQLENGGSLQSEEDGTKTSVGSRCHHVDSTAPEDPHAAAEGTAAAALNWTQLEQDGTESLKASHRCPADTSPAFRRSGEARCEHQAEECAQGHGGCLEGVQRPPTTDPRASIHASEDPEPSNHGSKSPVYEPAGPLPYGAVARVSSCVFFRRQVDAFKHADRVNQHCTSRRDAEPQSSETAGGHGSCTDGTPKKISAQWLHSAAREGTAQVFCSELPNDGYGSGYTRQFVVGTLQALWQYYRNLQQQEKHLYEVIRDGQPCRIYCDLEYSQKANTDIHGEALVDLLLDEIMRQVRDLWEESLDPCRDVLELDSSTSSKFSRHLIINIPGCALRCNATAGNLLQRCLDANPGHFAVRKEPQSSNTTPFVDMSVYSRNRHFRVYLSSKATKQARLLPTGRFAGANHSNPRDLWMASLVCNIDPQSRVLSTPSCSSPNAGKVIAVVPYRCLEERALGFKDDPGNSTAGILTGLGQDEAQLVQFIQDMASSRSGNHKAVVRSIAACGDAAKFAFNLDGPGSHYCDNIGRAHKSNHVFFVVDLEKRVYAQKCFDPDCRSYRSPWHPLPLLSKGSTGA